MTAATVDPVTIEAAYRHCEQVTRDQARNFSYGIRLLPAAKRRALSAVYALARRIDDIGDGTLSAPARLAALQAVRDQLAGLAGEGAAVRGEQAPAASPAGAGDTPQQAIEPGDDDLVLVAIADAARRYPIPLPAFGELIEGCEADVRGTGYPTFADLQHYCRCVAGSIGRLSLGVFGSEDPAVAEPLADALGLALQLTNILRDVREDFGNGRVYLPADDLAAFGCPLDPAQGGPLPAGPALEELVRFEAQRALGWYADGLRLLPMLDRRSAACTGAMAGIYLRLLQQIAADPGAALAHRMSLPPLAKAMVAARSLAGLAPRARVSRKPSGPDPVTPQEARP
jgi:15-cis-phytoene synthase